MSSLKSEIIEFGPMSFDDAVTMCDVATQSGLRSEVVLPTAASLQTRRVAEVSILVMTTHDGASDLVEEADHIQAAREKFFGRNWHKDADDELWLQSIEKIGE